MNHISKRASYISLTIIVLSLGLSSEVSADTIEFKNGAVLIGTVVEQDSETLTINVSGATTTYSKLDIEKIKMAAKVISPPPPPPLSASAPPSPTTKTAKIQNTKS